MLLHGLATAPLMMRPLARRLERSGRRVVNWSYPSFRDTIADHARRLHSQLIALDADPAVRWIHLATYSMGSIIARYALLLGAPAKLGRMVMIAPPNRGSRWASLFGPFLRCCIRTVDEIAARPDSFVNTLPPPEQLDFGVIAANCDLLVGCANTHLAGEKDHVVLRGTHSTIVMQRRTAQAVLEFLAGGRFARPGSPETRPADQSP